MTISVYRAAPLSTPSSHPLPGGSRQDVISEPPFGPRLGSVLLTRELVRPQGRRRSGHQLLVLRRLVPQQLAPRQTGPQQLVILRLAPQQLETLRLANLH
jgi:hypothetical protein